MSLEDQAKFGLKPFDSHPPTKTDSSEKKEQGSFANWILLQNSKGRDIPFSWHATNSRSKATPGTPDFWVGVQGGIWIEFKRDYSCVLSEAQEEFQKKCHRRGVPFFVVYSAFEAIKIVEEADPPLV
jgi:hypothetical protein